jgi:hypothetical protein
MTHIDKFAVGDIVYRSNGNSTMPLVPVGTKGKVIAINMAITVEWDDYVPLREHPNPKIQRYGPASWHLLQLNNPIPQKTISYIHSEYISHPTYVTKSNEDQTSHMRILENAARDKGIAAIKYKLREWPTDKTLKYKFDRSNNRVNFWFE